MQERAKDISLEMAGAGKDKLQALIADEVARLGPSTTAVGCTPTTSVTRTSSPSGPIETSPATGRSNRCSKTTTSGR